MNRSVIVHSTAMGIAALAACTALTAGAQQAAPKSGTDRLEVRLRTDAIPPAAPLTGKVKAYTITGPGQMMPGKFADGFLGDFVLENDLVRAVVGRPDKAQVNPAGGGNLIDLASQKFPIDYINFVQTVADLDSTQSQVQYSDAEDPRVEGGTTATVVVRGKVTAEKTEAGTPADVDVTTTYALPKNSNRLLISTRFTNNTTVPVSIAPGDVVDWGMAHTFVEGVGMITNPSEEPALYALASVEDFSVGYVTSGTRPLIGLHTARNSVVQAIPVRKAAPPAAVPPPSEAAQTRPGANVPQILAPEELPAEVDRPPFYFPPPGPETRIMSPSILQPPRPETPYAPETRYAPVPVQPNARVTTSALVLPSEATDADFPRPVPGGDGERFPADSPTTGTATADGTTETVTAADGSTTAPEEEARIVLAPGESFTFERFLVVSDSDFSRIAAAAYDLKDVTTGSVVGIVLEAGTETPIAGAEVLVSGGPNWDRRSPPSAFTKTSTRADGTYVLNLPVGHYILTPTKVGRISSSGPSSVEITTGAAPRIVPLTLTRESVIRVAVTEADAKTSVPLPSKITFIAKPGTMPIQWGYGPGISRGIGNVYYMPYGAAVIPVTPGRYQITVSRGIEYGIRQGELTVVPGSDNKLEFTLPHELKGELQGMISADIGVMTSASAVGTASPADRVVQAVAEGVQVLVTGDYGVATDLQPEINRLGLGRYIKAFPGMRLLLEKDELRANVLLYPLTRELAGRIKAFAEKNRDMPPDVLISDLRREFPNVIVQVDTPLDPQQGYLTPFAFDEIREEFEDGIVPPPDFDAVQVVEGKKWPLSGPMMSRYEQLAMARTREQGAPPLSGLGGSLSRLAFGEEVGYPRTYLYTSNDSVDKFTAEDLVRAIRGQHYVVTNGPVMTLNVYNPKTGKFDAGPGDVVDHSTTSTIQVKINVVAAPWIPFSNFDVLFNGSPVDKTEVMPTTRVLRYPVQANPDTAIRRRHIDSDLMVTGFTFSSRRSLAPVVPASPPDFGGEVYPVAWTGPIFIDKDGDGRVMIPPKERKKEQESAGEGEEQTTGIAEPGVPDAPAPQ